MAEELLMVLTEGIKAVLFISAEEIQEVTHIFLMNKDSILMRTKELAEVEGLIFITIFTP